MYQENHIKFIMFVKLDKMIKCILKLQATGMRQTNTQVQLIQDVTKI